MIKIPGNAKVSALLIFFFAVVLSGTAFGQNDTYYNSIDPSNSGFVYSLKQRIRSPYTRNSYGNYQNTLIPNFYARDTLSGQKVINCLYSGEFYIYTPPFSWTPYSREHTWCQSWMPSGGGSSTDEYQDYHHLFPLNQNNANGVRSNHPLGVVNTIISSYLEGKYGRNTSNQLVYEPRNSHKGDAARAILYMSVRYDSINGFRWTFNQLNNVILPGLGEAPQDIQTLLDWHKQDPPDEFEVARNNYIESIQSNRNPFIDHPEYVNYINFADGTKLSPAYATEPTNFPTSFTAAASGTSITLNWTDATGAQVPAGYFIEAFSTNSYIIPIDGYAITADANLSDGRAFVYVAQGTQTYQFTGLNPNTTYYFRIHPYNGSGTTINFKLGSTRPSASTTTGTGVSPAIVVSASSFVFGGVVAGTNSSAQSYTLSGTNLTGAVSIAPPSGMQVSLSSGSGYVSYPSTLSISPASGTITSTPVYVRYSPASATGAYSDTIKITGGGVTQYNIIATGTALSTEPTVQSAITVGSVTTTTVALTFSGGNGSRRIIVVSPALAVTFVPIDGNAINGVSSVFTTAVDQGDGNKVVYDGTGSSVTITGLTLGTLYYFAVYEYNLGTGSSQNYYTTSPGTASTTTVTNTPTITASATTLTFASTVTGVNSSEQSYTVSGSNLSSNVTVTPPVGFQISLSSGTGFVSNPSSLTITQSGGSVSGTTVYVRFSPSSAAGAVTGNITLTATGATTINVSLTGNSISAEPTAQASLSLGSITSSAITATLTAGNGGRRIVVVKQGSAVTYTPTDGTTISGVSSSFTTATDQGSGNKVVYDGTGTSVTVSGLTGSTQYYFAVYEYAMGTGTSQNYLTSSPGTGNATTSSASAFNYTWVSGSTNFASAASWNPARNSINTQDVLNFNTGTSLAISGLTTQTVTQINISNNTTVNLTASAASNITVVGGNGADLVIDAGSTLQFSGASACSLTVNTGATASISGSVVLGGGAHKLLAVDSLAIQFNSGAVCSTGTSFSGNAFGTTSLNSVVFNAGSSYIQTIGSNPFGATAPNSVVLFKPGSWYRYRTGGSPSVVSRTFANFEFDPTTGTSTASSSGAVTFDTLKVNSGTLNLPMTGGVNIKNDLIVTTGATFTFSPVTVGSLNFTGTTAQRISGGGTITLGADADVTINNSAGVTLDRNLSIRDSLRLTTGVLTVSNGSLLLDTLAKVTGTFSSSNMIVPASTGEVRKAFNALSSFTLPVGTLTPSARYSPVDITLSSYSGLVQPAYIGVKVSAAKHGNNYAPVTYLSRNWTLTQNGMTSPVCSLAFTYNAADVQGTEAQLYGGRWNGTKWTLSSVANTGAKKISFTSVSPAGDYTAAEDNYMGAAVLLSLTAVTEGMYNSGTQQAIIGDTVKAYVTTVGNPGVFVDSARAKIDSVTLTGVFPFRLINDGTYYFAVKPRNGLITWSKQGGESFVKGARTVYSFVNDSSLAYGNNVVRKGNKYCLYSGDLNNDGVIDLTDLLLIDNDNANFVSGYIDTDINGDGVVDLTDLLVVDNNNAAFVSSQVPPGAAEPVRKLPVKNLTK